MPTLVRSYGSAPAAGVGTQKNWNQHHRQGQRGMAWIVGGLETF